MTDQEDQERSGGAAEGAPQRSRLGRILAEQPEARPRLGRALGSLLAVVLVAIAVLGLLAIWHLRRRAQLIRNRPAPPGKIFLPNPQVGLASERDDD